MESANLPKMAGRANSKLGGYDAGMETMPRFYQLSLRTLLEVVAAIAVILAFAYQRGGASGRYQMISHQQPGGRSEIFMYDTATGQVWQQEFDGSWTAATMPSLKR
jgi:hypothetical protein